MVLVVKNPPANAGDGRAPGSIPGSERRAWQEEGMEGGGHGRRRAWKPSPVFLPRESHGQRSLPCYGPWGCKESDTTEVTACTGGRKGMLSLSGAMSKTFNKYMRNSNYKDCGSG